MGSLPEEDPFLAAQADIHEAVRRPFVQVCPEPKLLFAHNGHDTSLARNLANDMANDTDLSDNQAYGPDKVNVESLDGKFSVFVVEDTSDNCYHSLKELYRKTLFWAERFHNDTFVSLLLVTDGRINDLARLIQQRLVALGAAVIAPMHTISHPNQAAQLQAFQNWRNNILQPSILAILQGLAVQQQLFVARQTNSDQAYAILHQHEFAPIPLAGGRGHVYKGIVLRRNGHLFMASSEESAVHVAIKVFDVPVVLNQLQQGSNENPWREVTRFLLLKDTGIVPELFESLFDGRYLYIITRWADGGSLADGAHRNPDGRMGIEAARDVARQIFDILKVLHEQFGIAHHDLKPANFLMHSGQVLITDFAQSVRFPPGGMLRATNIPLDLRGTLAFMLPEHFNGQEYDARAFDLWTAGATLFSLVTGLPSMYRIPSAQDFLYEFMILAQSVSRVRQNPRVQAIQERLESQITLINGYLEIAVIDVVLEQSPQNAARAASLTNYLSDLKRKQSTMIEITARIRSLPESLLALFERVFDPDPQNRWTRERLEQMPWMTNT